MKFAWIRRNNSSDMSTLTSILRTIYTSVSMRIGEWCSRRAIVGCMWMLLLSHLNARKTSSTFTLLYNPRTRTYNIDNKGVDGRELGQDNAPILSSCTNICTACTSVHLPCGRTHHLSTHQQLIASLVQQHRRS
jgi:hypothetical protein